MAIPSFSIDRHPNYNPKRYQANSDNEIKKVFFPLFFPPETLFYLSYLKHKLEMELIYKYSPFKTINELFDQFNKIEGESGTLVVCYNLWLTGDSKTEFMVDADKKDLILTGDCVDKSDIKEYDFRFCLDLNTYIFSFFFFSLVYHLKNDHFVNMFQYFIQIRE